MSPGPLDLRAALFLTVEETAQLFRQNKAWVYRNRNGILKPAARRFGPKSLLFLQSELQRLIAEAGDPPPLPRRRSKIFVAVKTGKRHNGSDAGDRPGPSDPTTGGGTDG